MTTETHEYLTLDIDDICAATPEQLDEWFPGWRRVAADIRHDLAQQALPEGTPSATPR
jgi:hypothetical protein